MKKKLLISLVVILKLTFAASSQMAALNISAPDSCSFKLHIGALVVNNFYCNSITLQGLEAGKTEIKFEFVNGKYSSLSQWITLKPNTRSDYFVQIMKGVPKLQFSAESVARNNVQNVPFDSTAVISEISVYYEGKLGCENPLSDEEFEEWLEDVDNSLFESQKLTKLLQKDVMSCLKVEQLFTCLLRLDAEENKLKVLSRFSSAIYDLDDRAELLHAFILKVNRESARVSLNLH
ncbi:MAG: DUF4476 domain-containing protein [Flavobacteriales bacterium]|nr:DUF4476 domain-containing protein [Flavobacteriales bacterium]